ncbi:alkylmercury lyase [Thermosporothrix hazakensis]|jgi:alkylmercury lyase|uniref:Alkylmercury lyase n=1 Tax=Thermosporothrix hazakensis TaxID=644383 RepID=A0A326UC72_THEHA|nr:alkylmercury lyase MerB [Thermosporothrix hazakensis]PZW34269.1 alkylmercury lyase [Thermosporothrix hazakensis]GCE46179.1 alkylmercury (organomercurial) lyase MerB [Thermosporothrix hazakensis]
MSVPSLEAITTGLIEQLQSEQKELRLLILRRISQGGPVSKAQLASELHISEDGLEKRLHQLPDTEYNENGDVVGWGVTLVPTRHHFQVNGKQLYTWCAFDTVLFPPCLGQEAHVLSHCPTTGEPISFVASPSGAIRDLSPTTSILALLIAFDQNRVRQTFCENALFFSSERAATPYLATHPNAVLLSLEQASQVGQQVAAACFGIKK